METRNQLRGTCRFVGHVTEIGNGIFVGVELDESVGDHGNDGSIQGTRYFSSLDGHGQFVLIEQCTKISGAATSMMTAFDENSSTKQLLLHHHDEQSQHHHHHNGPLPVAPDHDHVDHRDHRPLNHPVDGNVSLDLGGPSRHHFVCDDEVDMESARKSLGRALSRRQSQHDLVRYGIVPQNYFVDPLAAQRQQAFGHRAVHSSLEDWLPLRQSMEALEESNIVPVNYFVDPLAASQGRLLVKEMISEQLDEFHTKRPTLYELQRRNILPAEYVQIDSIDGAQTANNQATKPMTNGNTTPQIRDHHEASKMQKERVHKVQKQLTHKLAKSRRPTITDLGDMHIIPHDYLDNLLVRN